ncbi:MAG: response regulator [Acidobacteria bacterium]|nr:MAG: response regulator [Acidobacteriota bacterium]
MVGLLGLLSVGLLYATYQISERHVGESAPLALAAADLRAEIASAHLWLEEFLGGDTGIRLDDMVWTPLARAESIACKTFGACGRDAGSERDGAPLSPPARRRLGTLLAAFATTARERVAIDKGSEVGAALDQSLDASYAQIMDIAVAIQRDTHRIMAGHQRRARRMLLAILGVWVIVVGIAIGGIERRERRRRAAAAERRRFEQRLRQAEVEKQRSQRMEAIGRLAGSLAHDINNYLGAISIQCELARRARDDRATLEHELGEALATIGRATSLTRQLLAFGRRQPGSPETVDINKLITGMETMLVSLVGERTQVETELASDTWPVRVDPAQFEQIVLNLVINAHEAMSKGGAIRITTSNRRTREAGVPARDEVVLEVSDEGHGIAPEIRERIFEPFFTTKRGGHSSGLGLSTVFGIVENAGGRVELDSQPGAGTTFRILLPRSDAGEDEERAATSAPAAVDNLRPLDVLLLENHAPLRRGLQRMLEDAGHRVCCAANGAEGLGAFARDRGRWDLVITDIVMPVCTGDEVARIVWKRRPELPVLFVSGFTDHVEIDELIAGRPARFLRKPFTSAELAAAVAELVAGRPGARGPSGMACSA